MSAYESSLDTASQADDDNVVMFRPRQPESRRTEGESESVDMERFPVDIRGNVTFGRLMIGLATVGLAVRVDSRTGRVVITDDARE